MRFVRGVTDGMAKFVIRRDGVAVAVKINKDMQFGLRFRSPEEVLDFCDSLIDVAAEKWPDDLNLREFKG